MMRTASALHWRAWLLAALAVLGAAGCASVNPDYDPQRVHHTPSGFRNPYAQAPDDGFWEWQWQRLRHGVAPQNASLVPVAATDAALLRAPNPDTGVRATWIGQSTMLLQLGAVNVLTDPIFSRRASPLQSFGPARAVALPVELAQLPHIDVVLISDNQYDHLDADTVAALDAQPGGPPLFVVPLGVERWFKEHDIASVKRLDWWERTAVKGVQITMTPTQHWSQRTPFDRDATLWGGYLLEHRGFAAWFVGDTGFAPELFDDIAAHFSTAVGRIDVALIPIGCYEPRWFMQTVHVNPEEAVRIHREVNPRLSIGIDWGTFRLCDEPVEQAMKDLPMARRELGVADDAFVLFAIGETRKLR